MTRSTSNIFLLACLLAMCAAYRYAPHIASHILCGLQALDAVQELSFPMRVFRSRKHAPPPPKAASPVKVLQLANFGRVPSPRWAALSENGSWGVFALERRHRPFQSNRTPHPSVIPHIVFSRDIFPCRCTISRCNLGTAGYLGVISCCAQRALGVTKAATFRMLTICIGNSFLIADDTRIFVGLAGLVPVSGLRSLFSRRRSRHPASHLRIVHHIFDHCWCVLLTSFDDRLCRQDSFRSPKPTTFAGCDLLSSL